MSFENVTPRSTHADRNVGGYLGEGLCPHMAVVTYGFGFRRSPGKYRCCSIEIKSSPVPGHRLTRPWIGHIEFELLYAAITIKIASQ